MANLPENWIECELHKIANIFTGNSINEKIKKDRYTNRSSGINYIATKDIGYDNNINYENGIKIPEGESTFKIAPSNSSLLCMQKMALY